MAERSKTGRLAREIAGRCRGVLKRQEPMSAHTQMGMGGPADLFFLPADLEDLSRAMPTVRDAGLPVLPLGGGTNLLVRSEGFRGLVICLTYGARRIDVHQGLAQAQAGASLQVLSRHCRRAGGAGLEFASGIPGTVGGAICGNAGAWGSETMDRVDWVAGVSLRSGEAVRLAQSEVPYRYRWTGLPEDLLILEAGFRLDTDDPASIQARMDEMRAQRRASQPLWNRNAGCIFKNPPNTSAGLLIDRAGCKGLSSGGAAVSDLHANFIVNRAEASPEDVLRLIEMVRDRVMKAFGVALEAEVRIVGAYGVENA